MFVATATCRSAVVGRAVAAVGLELLEAHLVEVVSERFAAVGARDLHVLEDLRALHDDVLKGAFAQDGPIVES